ncbi:PilT protein domain protein [Candidatus Desulfarcum epimagneticum]|uniref:PilT protein domain protein n=1 Tax=uncultured Desulfobacteraceae bacterium TaxID=218296 RepID=A0A484HGU0_9BACT|nr:PilT protein domain protein [uncultured Desulfobacteraceae bacterium]
MIVIDTHIWVWWTHGNDGLSDSQSEMIKSYERDVIGVSDISCWEITKLVEYGRIQLPYSLEQWFEKALNYPGVKRIELTPEIAIESTQLPGNFHRDPADQIIVATARIFNCPLVTSDRKILDYEHVKTIG